MSATFMYAGAGLAALVGTALFTTKDLSTQVQAFAEKPIFPDANASEGGERQMFSAIQLDGLHPYETFELRTARLNH